jgi:DNA-3-methyladenine glycosylase II
LQEAAKLALGLKERPDARRLEEIAERWRPLRGIAARMLWAYYRAARQRVGMALEGG